MDRLRRLRVGKNEKEGVHAMRPHFRIYKFTDVYPFAG